jgi:hypothetical protein
MTRRSRHLRPILRLVAAAACLAGGSTGPAAAAEIGDPWWDEAAAEGSAAVEPALGQRPNVQQRMALQRKALAEAALRRELSVVRAIAADLDPAARRQVRAAGEQAVERLAAGGGPVQASIQQQSAEVIQVFVEQTLAQVDPDRAAAYRGEISARAARRRAAALAALVEAIDQEALLTEAERVAVAAGLEDRWQPAWESLALAASRSRITAPRLPPGVAEAARQVLDPERFAAWQERLRPAQP